MPKTPLEKELEEAGITSADLAKLLAVKLAATAVIVVGVGVASHLIENKLFQKKG